MPPEIRIAELEPVGFVETINIPGNRGPCGGVWRILEILDIALAEIDGREPLYINWNPVNNIILTQAYERKGLINFKNNYSLLPERSLVIDSAHGVGPVFHQKVKEKNGTLIGVGSCQLVLRQQVLSKRAQERGYYVVFVGVEGHPETVGVMGGLDGNNSSLIESVEDVDKLVLPPDARKTVYTQTTLSTDEVDDIYDALKSKFPEIEIPKKKDICYATDARQSALKAIIGNVDMLLVVGSGSSHNSTELRKIGEKAGKPSFQLDDASQLKPDWFHPGIRKVCATSGASVPDSLLEPVVGRIVEINPKSRIVYEDQVVDEDLEMVFKYDADGIRETIRKHFEFEAA